MTIGSETQLFNIKEYPCIRCDECALVCPVKLQPLQLHWYSQEFNEDRLDDYNLFACVECGNCSSVCPSHIPLVDEFKQAKSDILTKRSKRLKAEQNKQRYLKKQARIEQQKQDKIKKRATVVDKNADDDLAMKKKQDAIAAAVSRVKQKREQKQKQKES